MPRPTSITTKLEEKVGLANYSNVTYSATITTELEDGDTPESVLAFNEEQIESWMKDYFRREVEAMLQGGK